MTRTRTLVIATAIAATAGMLMAPAAYGAITNPAKNPQYVVVVVDGVEYVDGQDTLPGYDDIDCTYIPGAKFDFENNRVKYADGQSIPWTEWDRIPGYHEWLKKKRAAQQEVSSSSSSSSPSSASTSSSSVSSSSANSANSQAQAQAEERTITQVASAGDEIVPSVSPSAEPSAAPSAAPSAEPSEEPEVEAVLDAAPPADVADASGAGRVILGGLFGLGVITFLAYEIVRRRTGRTVA